MKKTKENLRTKELSAEEKILGITYGGYDHDDG